MGRNRHITNTLCEISEHWGPKKKKKSRNFQRHRRKSAKAQLWIAPDLLAATTEAKRQWEIAFKIPAFPTQPKRVHQSGSAKTAFCVLVPEGKVLENSERKTKKGKYEVQETRVPTRGKAEETSQLMVKIKEKDKQKMKMMLRDQLHHRPRLHRSDGTI